MEPKPAYNVPPKKPTPRVDILENILCAMTEEDAVRFSENIKTAYLRAKERSCQQTVGVLLGGHGWVVRFILTDDSPPLRAPHPECSNCGNKLKRDISGRFESRCRVCGHLEKAE